MAMRGDDDGSGLMRLRPFEHHHHHHRPHLPPLLNLMPPPPPPRPLSSCASSSSSRSPPAALPWCPGTAGPLLRLGQEFGAVNSSEEDAPRASSTSSPIISALSTASGRPRPRPTTADEEEEEEEEDEGAARKKLRLSKEQTAVLEQSFKAHSGSLNPKLKISLARRLNVTPRQVEVWFQNRRARTKLKQTEVECEVLRRCCERLEEENKRLRDEAEELRAQQQQAEIKLMQSSSSSSPPPRFYMRMFSPAAALYSVCPSCDLISSEGRRSPGGG